MNNDKYTYSAWQNMVHFYGPRTFVCERWLTSFENFWGDMGGRPHGTVLRRFDSCKGFTPDNCKWSPKETQAERFWSRVNKADQCWLWTGATNRGGYGTFKFGDRARLAHHVSLLLSGGTIPAGLCVLHKCDNPPCVNPAHLFTGTRQDNVADRDAKGRNRVGMGERHGLAKLTNARAAEIKSRLAVFSGYGAGRALAKEFGVSGGIISGIKCGRTWAHLQPKESI